MKDEQDKSSKGQNEYQSRVNRVMDYIADHLDESLTLELLAEVSGFSPFYFHRIFKSVTGETLAEATKRLRLEKAVFLKKYSKRLTLTDIAFRCGFNSSTDFSRAFKAFYGQAPSKFDPENISQKRKICKADEDADRYYSFGSPDARHAEHQVEIIKMPALNVAYLRIVNAYAEGRVVAGFDRMMGWAKQRGFDRAGALIGMSQDDPDITPLEKYRYDVCYTVPENTAPEGDIGVRRLPANRYACLRIQGDFQAMVEGWDYLFKLWLPNSQYQPTHDPAMEVYIKTPAEIGWSEFDFNACIPVTEL